MAVVAIANSVLTFGLVIVHAAFGWQCLRRFRWPAERWLDSALCSVAFAFGLSALLMFSLGIVGWLRPVVVWALVSVMGVAAGRAGWRGALGSMRQFWRALSGGAARGAGLAWLVLLTGVLLLSLLTVSAPLTGSDALSYHFMVPRLYEDAGRVFPVFWHVNSFFSIGTGHGLILLGTMLGDASTGLRLCHLGGVLSTLATYALARRFMPANWALLTAALLLVAPMTFWQMSVAGAPDMWTTLYTVLAVLTLLNWSDRRDEGSLGLCGFFAGLAASSKYTGWAVPLLVLPFVIFFGPRSAKGLGKALLLFVLPVLVAGSWRHVLNYVWTGDPVFPFLARLLAVENFNTFTYEKMLTGTRAPGFTLTPWRFVTYPFLLTLEGRTVGVGHYFGPIILSLAPIALVSSLTARLRIVLLLCLGFFVTNWLTSQVGRFLLPVFPLALVLSVHALWWLTCRPGLRIARTAAWTAVGAFLCFGVAASALYARDFLPVVVGTESREAFLRRMAPDYEIAEYVNEAIAGQPGKVMVFFRHTYYLTVPFVHGDPRISWIMTLERTKTADSLHQLLQELDVRWVVETGPYPFWLESSFRELKRRGLLTEGPSTDVENFSGNRIYGRRGPVRVVILRVEPRMSYGAGAEHRIPTPVGTSAVTEEDR